MARNLHYLVGNEPMGLRGRGDNQTFTVLVNGKWYDHLTASVVHARNGRGSDRIVEAVNLAKPLTSRQLKGMVKV